MENTLPAIEATAGYGADYAEIDVQLSADGVPVVLHDGNLWRLAGQNLNVSELTADQLTALELPATGAATRAGRIPTLEEPPPTAHRRRAGRPEGEKFRFVHGNFFAFIRRMVYNKHNSGGFLSREKPHRIHGGYTHE